MLVPRWRAFLVLVPRPCDCAARRHPDERPESRSRAAQEAALGAVVLALALVDFVALRGESLGGGTVSLRADSDPLTLSIDRSFENHRIQIRTRRRVSGESRGQTIACRLEDLDGAVLVDESELVSRKSRYFTFRPSKTGAYQLHVEETKLVGSGRGTAQVSVAVNDRRVLSPLLGF